MITKAAFAETMKTLKDLFNKEENFNEALDDYDETMTHNFLPYHNSFDQYGAGLMVEAFEIADCSNNDTQNFLEILYYFMYDCNFGENDENTSKLIYSSFGEDGEPDGIVTEQVDFSSAENVYDYLVSRIQGYEHGYC